MKATEIKDGMRVLYRPIKGRPDEFVGTIDGEPWQLGHGAWVVNIDMDHQYAEAHGRMRVRAASLDHVRGLPAGAVSHG